MEQGRFPSLVIYQMMMITNNNEPTPPLEGNKNTLAYHFSANIHIEYDTLSANVVKSFPKLAKSESGQIVSEKVKLT